MKGDSRIGRVFGTQRQIHFGWLLAPIVIALIITIQHSAITGDWGSTAFWTVWTTAFVTGLLFFATVIFRELALALVMKIVGLAKRSKMQSGFRDIELSHLEANDPATGYVLGFAGPIFSLTIGAFCLLSAVILGWSPEMHGADPPTSALAAIVWLGVLNVVWAIFNFIPVSPFDGGRVFRAMVWMRSHKKARSKRLAVHISQFIATFFLVWGAFQILGGGLNGLWLLLIGAISLTSARGAYESPRDVKIISPLRVDDLMQRDCEIVHGQMDLQVFVNEHLLRTGNQYYFVAENDRLAGMITPAEVMLMRHARLTNKTVGQVMCTLDDFQIVAPQMPIAKVYETMMMAEVDQLPVASDNQLIGIITRDDILRNSYTHFISEN